jgi:hypothetical protein
MSGTRVSYLDEQQSLEGYLIGKPPAIASRIASVEVVAIVPKQSVQPLRSGVQRCTEPLRIP